MDIIAGAALGTLFSALYKVVENLVRTSSQFQQRFQDIKCTLDLLQPLIEQIEDLNAESSLLSREIVEDFRKEIVEGIRLVNECSGVGRRRNGDQRWSYRYSKKLAKLDGSLKRRLEILTAYGILDGRKDTKKLVRMIQRLSVALVAMVLIAISLFLWYNGLRLHGN